MPPLPVQKQGVKSDDQGFFSYQPETLPSRPNNEKTLNMSDVKITAYNVKTKEKGCEMHDAVITKTAKGAYMAQGNDGKGNKLTTLMGEEKALAAIKAGVAKQGW
jgi:hypothetical protein